MAGKYLHQVLFLIKNLITRILVTEHSGDIFCFHQHTNQMEME